mgnify:CR=1 FL=1
MSRAIGQSWGRYPRVEQRIIPVLDRNGALPLPSDGGTVLAHGNGRSYGDSCLNPGATLLTSRNLDRFIDFDPATGVVAYDPDSSGAGAAIAVAQLSPGLTLSANDFFVV